MFDYNLAIIAPYIPKDKASTYAFFSFLVKSFPFLKPVAIPKRWGHRALQA
jgi:hypothetical protein